MDQDVFRKSVERYVGDQTVLVGISATVLSDLDQDYFFGISDEDFAQRIDMIRSRNPNIKLVGGGGQINNATPSVISGLAKLFDYVSIGQGENTLLAIYNHVKHGAKLTTTTIQRPYVVTDVSYPFNDFNSSRNIFLADDDILYEEALPLELARGCIFKCKFCSYDLTNKKSMDYTKAEDILREEFIHNWENFGTRYYHIVDDLINDSTEKINMLERVIKSLPFKIYFSGFMRLDLLRSFPQMIQQLKDIGLISCLFGIETINDASGRAVGKGLGRARIEQTLENCFKIWQGDVYVEAHFILGLPHDTEETAIETRDWAREMQNRGWIHHLVLRPLVISADLGKADIDKDPSKYGYEIINYNEDLDEISEFTTRHRKRYSGQTSTWINKNYSWYKAHEFAFHANKWLSQNEIIPNLNTFNASAFLQLISNFMEPDEFILIATGKTKTTKNKLMNILETLEYLMDQHIQQYFNKLLKL